jgi:hypothetical protein
MSELETRIAALDWPALLHSLDTDGYATTGALLAPETCAALIESYEKEALFRSRVVMARHGFGQGEYQYFRYPLPKVIATLRDRLYPHLVPLANRWQDRLGLDMRFPDSHAEYIAQCHAAGQQRPTPLLLKYGPGDYNRLHQDLYGAQVFPLQLTLLLNDGFDGGEFVLVENKPRSQSRAEVVPLRRGEAVIFAVNTRPVAKKDGDGTRGSYRVAMRHGVSRIRSGARYTLGVIFHDAS